MDEEKIVLEPCPFCEVEAQLHTIDDQVKLYWFAHKISCFLSGNSGVTCIETTDPDKIKEWNTRAGR